MLNRRAKENKFFLDYKVVRDDLGIHKATFIYQNSMCCDKYYMTSFLILRFGIKGILCLCERKDFTRSLENNKGESSVEKKKWNKSEYFTNLVDEEELDSSKFISFTDQRFYFLRGILTGDFSFHLKEKVISILLNEDKCLV